ncbi:MAG: ABC transporter permease [Armatimonadota bacterium]
MQIIDLNRLRRTYFGNPTATRDQRVQLRGSKAVVLFTLYLVIMALVLYVAYDSAMGASSRSLATAQQNLQGFYWATIGCLGVVITIVAPAVGAFAIVTEKQRRSLDLVFSAPVEPKFYLVGKLISAYRYVWLLLILALPFCAVSVTLGGTTWIQLFIAFLLFSFYGLVCVAFGLLLSAMSTKPIPALCWTYCAIGAYWFFTFYMMMMGIAGGAGGRGASPFSSVSPIMAICPMTFPFQGGQSAMVFGKEIPVWLISIAEHLLAIKVIILGAGSIMSPSDGREIKSLRIHGLIYFAALAALVGWGMAAGTSSSLGSSTTGISSTEQSASMFGRGLAGMLSITGICLVPYLSTFGVNEYRRFRFNGLFDLRKLLGGTVAGNLPYLLLFAFSGIAGYVFGTTLDVSTAILSMGGRGVKKMATGLELFTEPMFLMYILLAAGIWTLMWVSGILSAAKHQNISRARTMSLFSLVGLALVPTFFLSIVAPESLARVEGLWAFNIIASIFCNIEHSYFAVIHGAVLMLVSLVLIVSLNKRLKLLKGETPS